MSCRHTNNLKGQNITTTLAGTIRTWVRDVGIFDRDACWTLGLILKMRRGWYLGSTDIKEYQSGVNWAESV